MGSLNHLLSSPHSLALLPRPRLVPSPFPLYTRAQTRKWAGKGLPSPSGQTWFFEPQKGEKMSKCLVNESSGVCDCPFHGCAFQDFSESYGFIHPYLASGVCVFGVLTNSSFPPLLQLAPIGAGGEGAG